MLTATDYPFLTTVAFLKARPFIYRITACPFQTHAWILLMTFIFLKFCSLSGNLHNRPGLQSGSHSASDSAFG